MSGCDWLRKAASLLPEYIGKTIYFSTPESLAEIECTLNDDGTISTLDNPAEKFSCPFKMVRALDMKDIFGKKLYFRGNLYAASGGKQLLQTLMQKKAGPMKSKKGSVLRQLQNCPGFAVPYPIANAKDIFVVIDNGVARSAKCTGSFRRQRLRTDRCAACTVAMKTALGEENVLRRRKLLCGGIPREPFENIIQRRHWDTDNRDIAMVQIFGIRLFARQCNGQNEKPGPIRCDKCNRCYHSLRKIAKRKPVNEERRLLHTAERYLSEAEKVEKVELVKNNFKKNYTTLQIKCRKLEAKLNRTTAELEKYKPKYPVNRRSMLQMKTYLDSETEKLENPICQWKENDQECGFKASHCNDLLCHVDAVHLRSQTEANSTKPPGQRWCKCYWRSCTRKAPFKKWALIYKHMTGHTGTPVIEQRLQVIREQLLNIGGINNKRFVELTKLATGLGFKSKRDWMHARQKTLFEMPGTSAQNVDMDSSGEPVVVDEDGMEFTVVVTEEQHQQQEDHMDEDIEDNEGQYSGCGEMPYFFDDDDDDDDI